MEHIRTDSITELVQLRRHASRFFVWLLWAHVPVVMFIASVYRTGWLAQGSIAAILALAITVVVRLRIDAFSTRASIAVALTAMPILFVYGAQGPWQIDFHMYFFAVFAMLAAFCDWRPIAISAVVTSLHHVILDAIVPASVFPTEGGIGRVALHASLVVIECGVLLWIIKQIRALFRSTAAARSLAEERLAAAQEAAETLAAKAALESELAEGKRTEAYLRHTAFHDDLTGLRSRSYFMDRLVTAVELGRKEAGKTDAVLFLDLDRFKLVNDSLGHRAGDHLLTGIAQRLKESIRPADTLARLGGDEFTILLEDISDIGPAIAIAQRIARALEAPFNINGSEIFSSASIGIALHSKVDERAEDLLRNADSAMYEAKRISGGRGGYVIYEDAMHVNSAVTLNLQNDLRRALERKEFRLYYQPIVALETERIIGFEALIRWEHPDRGMVPPADFISTAEDTGLIVEIGTWVLQESCRQIHVWEQQFGTDRLSVMSINVSSLQLTRSSFLAVLDAILDQTHADPCKIQLEITESVLLNNAELVGRTLSTLQARGIRIAFDDFGTGFSSLSYLQRYPVDTLKIDQSFVRGNADIGSNPEFIRTIVGLGHTLNLTITAEGVETAAQLEMVRSLGCSSAQGYHFSRPVPSDEIGALMAADDVRALAVDVLQSA